MPLRININDQVSVRLTDHGRKVLTDYYRPLSVPKYLGDLSGPVEFQLHHLMEIFGPHIGQSFLPVPFVRCEIVLLNVEAAAASA